MARLTDNDGRLLGGLEMPLGQLLAPLSPPKPTPTRTPEYAPEEVVFALECDYGSLDALTYSASPGVTPSDKRRKSPPRCHSPIEEPEERHHCRKCWGFYCQAHAEPFNHECGSVWTALTE